MHFNLQKLSGSMLCFAFVLTLCGCATSKTAGINNDLTSAAKSGNVKEVSRLLTEGADVNAKDKDGFTPLHYAVLLGMDIAERMITKGADIDAKGEGGVTPLHIAAG